MEVIEKIWGVIALGLGFYSLIAVVYPELRIRSAGSTFKAGALTHIGFAFVFIPMGIIYAFYSLTPKEAPGLTGLFIILGFVLAFLGLVVEKFTSNKRK